MAESKDQQILEDTVIQLNEELEEALQNLRSAESEKKAANEKVTQLETKIKKQDVQIQDLEDALSNAPPLKDMLVLKERVTQLQAENSILKNNLDQEGRRVDSSQTQTHLLNSTLDQLKEELAAAKETEESYNHRIEELEHSLVIAQEEKKLFEDMYTLDVEKLNTEIRSLKLMKSASDRKLAEIPNSNQENEIELLKHELLKLNSALENSNEQISNYKAEIDELQAKLQQQNETLQVMKQNESLDISHQHNTLSFLHSTSQSKLDTQRSFGETAVSNEREMYLGEIARLKGKLRERKTLLINKDSEITEVKANFEGELNRYRVKADLHKWQLSKKSFEGSLDSISMQQEVELSQSRQALHAFEARMVAEMGEREKEVQEREKDMIERETELKERVTELGHRAQHREAEHQTQLMTLDRAFRALQEEKNLLEDLYTEDTQKLQRELLLAKTASNLIKRKGVSDAMQAELLKAQHENAILQESITELESQIKILQVHLSEHQEKLEEHEHATVEEYNSHIKYLTKRVEELKLTDLAQRAKIDELTASDSQKALLVSQLQDDISVLNETIRSLSVRVNKMEGESKDSRGQILSARDTERKYAEAISQLTSLQSIHKQTVDGFEKEKLAFKSTAQQLAGIAGTAERDGTIMNARLSAAKRHIQDLETHVKLLTNAATSKGSIPSMPPSPLINRDDSLFLHPPTITTIIPTSPIPIPTTSPDASPIYSKKSASFVAKDSFEKKYSEDTSNRKDVPIPLSFEPQAPLQNYQIHNKLDANLEVHNVHDASDAVVELLESIKSWESKGKVDETSTLQLQKSLHIVKELAADANNRTKIRKLGGIEMAMRILSSSSISENISNIALDLVHSLSWEDNASILRQVSLSPIITRLNSADPQVRKLALGIIRNLSSSDENEGVLVNQGALRPLLRQLDEDIDLPTRIEVLKTIRNLSFAPDSKVEIKKCRGLESIVRHLKGIPDHMTSTHRRHECADCLEVRRMAIRVVSIISGDADIRKDIRNYDGIKYVVECLEDGELDTVRSAVGALLNISVNDKNKQEIVKCGAIEPLIQTIASTDAEISRFALRAMLNLVGADEAKNIIVSAEGTAKILSSCLDDQDMTTKRAAIRCLCSLASVPRFCTELVEIGSLPVILSCLYSSDDEILQHSIMLVGHLLVIEDTRKQLIRSQNITLIISQVMEQCKLFTQPQQQQQYSLQQQKQLVRACVKILDILVSNEEGALEIVSEKGIGTLVSIIVSAESSLSGLILTLITKLSNHKKCAPYFNEDFIRWTVSLLRNSDPGVIRCAVSIIENLVDHQNHKNALRTYSGISLMVVLLRDPSLVHIRSNVLSAISSLSTDASCAIDLTHHGVISSLVTLLSDSTTRQNAISTLANLTSHEVARNDVRETGGIRQIITILNVQDDGDTLFKKECTRFVYNLCYNESNREEFLRQGGMEPLLRSLNARDLQTLRLAIRTLCLLTSDATTRQLMANSACLHYIQSCIKNTDLEVVRSALGALVNLSLLPRIKTSVNIPLIADCLSTTDDTDCVKYAILCLKNLSSVDSNKRIMQGSHVVAKLVQRVWDGTGNQWNGKGIYSHPEQSIVNSGTRSSGESGIMTEPEILRAALGTLSRLVDFEGVDDEFRNQGGVDLVLYSITLPDAQLRRNALKLLYLVMKNSMENQMEVITKKGSKHIISCLASSNLQTRKYALQCLTLLINYGDCKGALQLGRDLVVECAKGEDPITSKLASSLLEAFDSISSRPISTPPPYYSHSSSPFLKSTKEPSRNTNPVHVNTFRY